MSAHDPKESTESIPVVRSRAEFEQWELDRLPEVIVNPRSIGFKVAPGSSDLEITAARETAIAAFRMLNAALHPEQKPS